MDNITGREFVMLVEKTARGELSAKETLPLLLAKVLATTAEDEREAMLESALEAIG